MIKTTTSCAVLLWWLLAKAWRRGYADAQAGHFARGAGDGFLSVVGTPGFAP